MTKLFPKLNRIQRASAGIRAALLATAFLGLVGGNGSAQVKKPSRQPDLSGIWQLNSKLSAESLRPREGIGLSASPQRVSSFEDWAAIVRDAQRLEISVRARELIAATATLEVFQHGRELTMNATASALVVLTRTVYTDGRTSEHRYGFGDMAQSQGKWEGKRLIVETTTRRGLKLTETYELSTDRSRLLVFVKLENGTQPLLIRGVYERRVGLQSSES